MARTAREPKSMIEIPEEAARDAPGRWPAVVTWHRDMRTRAAGLLTRRRLRRAAVVGAFLVVAWVGLKVIIAYAAYRQALTDVRHIESFNNHNRGAASL